MQVKEVTLNNYRNYKQVEVQLAPGKNILIGDNAQGKSNFLEAIEVSSRGKSARTSDDFELIAWKKSPMQLKVVFERGGYDEEIAISLNRPDTASRLEKRVTINGVKPPSTKALFGKLVSVTFSTQDLSMLRDGPKFRRDWIDTILFSLTPSYQDTLSNYQKVVTQRNRLLKTIFEKGRVTVSDQDQLIVWDKQLAHYGSTIIRSRIKLLKELLPLAEKYQSHLSKESELLTADYLSTAASFDESSEAEIADTLMTILKKCRAEEIARKQTVVGPHRDDITFNLNGASALAFASQGQQRSLVLSLKLAELDLIKNKLNESPVLLLDDVLAELDVDRQGLLMSALNGDMQTIITTTHLSKFEPEWLNEANIFSVTAGQVEKAQAIV
ncbi:MAG: DNA replication/repair protein RecF [Candidatus Obscuribacterales bacterium]|nr:DNA replication/repair protein RecF [Candidatus Obscuribacterales bacterium]